MDVLLSAVLHLADVRSQPQPHPIALSRPFTPPDRGIPDRRVGAGTR